MIKATSILAVLILSSTVFGQVQSGDPFAGNLKSVELIKEKIKKPQKLDWGLAKQSESGSAKELPDSIRHAIKLLESGNGVGFAQRYIEPESFVIAAAKLNLSPEEFFNRFLPNLADQSCVEFLRRATNESPTLLLDGRVALFGNKSELGNCWVLVDGKWKIRWNVPE